MNINWLYLLFLVFFVSESSIFMVNLNRWPVHETNIPTIELIHFIWPLKSRSNSENLTLWIMMSNFSLSTFHSDEHSGKFASLFFRLAWRNRRRLSKRKFDFEKMILFHLTIQSFFFSLLNSNYNCLSFIKAYGMSCHCWHRYFRQSNVFIVLRIDHRPSHYLKCIVSRNKKCEYKIVLSSDSVPIR